jgi:hypothetical protein
MDNKQLDSLINSAVKKINGKKENDICRYIPISTGGYIHHFTMRKMKGEDPKQLAEWINKYIVNHNNPQEVTPKTRAARGSRKRRDLFTLSKQDLEKMIHMARLAGDSEMVRKLTPPRDLKTIKKELISSVRHGRVDNDLWNLYAEAATNPSHTLAAALN